MASLRTCAAVRRASAFLMPNFIDRRGFLQQLQGAIPVLCRLGHSQSLWEELLGRKLEASTAKKLEDAFLEYKVEKSIPSWLPFFPNGSFWIPSNEDTIKKLRILAQRINESRTPSTEKSNSGKSATQWSGSINEGAISNVSMWSLITHIERLLARIETPVVDAASQYSPTPGMIIEVVLENNDEKDADIEAEDETNEKEKA